MIALRTLKCVLLLTLACVVPLTVRAAEPATKTESDSVKEAAEQVMNSISLNRTNDTFADLLGPYWPFIGEHKARGETLASDLRRAAAQMESALGTRLPGKYEFLGTKRLGNTYLTLVYVLNYQYGGLLVEFMFYNKGHGWLLNNATWTPNPAEDRVLWIRSPGPLASDLAPIRQATERAVKSFSDGLTNNAFTDLWKAYCVPGIDAAAQAESVATFAQDKKRLIEGTFGKRLPRQYEFLGAMRLGRAYAALVYVQKYEYGALPMTFLFYQSQGKWFLNNTSLADSAQGDLISLTANEPATPK